MHRQYRLRRPSPLVSLHCAGLMHQLRALLAERKIWFADLPESA
jgi:hypothetical protein